jgi:hypothetical protein
LAVDVGLQRELEFFLADNLSDAGNKVSGFAIGRAKGYRLIVLRWQENKSIDLAVTIVVDSIRALSALRKAL